jgi:hypothetical protein
LTWQLRRLPTPNPLLSAVNPSATRLAGFGIRKFDLFRIERLAFLDYVNVIHRHGA